MTNKPSELWTEFMAPTLQDLPKNDMRRIMNGKAHLCGLCGNTGAIVIPDGMNTSPAGYPVKGVTGYCICPNGRVMKKKGTPLSELTKVPDAPIPMLIPPEMMEEIDNQYG